HPFPKLFMFAFPFCVRKKKKRDKRLERIGVHGEGKELISKMRSADSFCFRGNWGNDTVEQLEGGTVTLWFEEGDDSGWNMATRTYSVRLTPVGCFGKQRY
ncbi:MAG: hypothetical protein J6S73_06905, partial [Lentisphaeria bacterium]|nr:hypothetical protein [Lentisphaeria bacterium]